MRRRPRTRRERREAARRETARRRCSIECGNRTPPPTAVRVEISSKPRRAVAKKILRRDLAIAANEKRRREILRSEELALAICLELDDCSCAGLVHEAELGLLKFEAAPEGFGDWMWRRGTRTPTLVARFRRVDGSGLFRANGTATSEFADAWPHIRQWMRQYGGFARIVERKKMSTPAKAA